MAPAAVVGAALFVAGVGPPSVVVEAAAGAEPTVAPAAEGPLTPDHPPDEAEGPAVVAPGRGADGGCWGG